VSARRLAVIVPALVALAGCSADEGDGGGREGAAVERSVEGGRDTRAADRGREAPSARGELDRRRAGASRGRAGASGRPVRLLLLSRFDQPTYLAAPRGDRRRFVVEREGTIRVVRGGRALRVPFLDIRGLVTTGGESGLLSMAFAPDYSRSRRFYVYYTDNEGFITIAGFRRARSTPDRALPSSRRTIMRVPHMRFNHKGGQLQFGPDGRLYAGFGDGGGGGDPDRNAQNLGRILGKLVRIEPRPGGGYSVPRDNPFRQSAGARPEVYAYGLRNPYRFSFDRRRGHLTVGDVGQDAVEEIDFVPNRRGPNPPGGYNFGWSVFEGRSQYRGGAARGHLPPVIAHSQGAGFCSIIGGYVIRDRALGRGWYGRYLYGDYCNSTLRLAFLKRGTAPTRPTRLRVPDLVSFGEDGRGRVYAVSLAGPVYRIGRSATR
jgi:Glucose / Sorbosone dehydrogenase